MKIRRHDIALRSLRRLYYGAVPPAIVLLPALRLFVYVSEQIRVAQFERASDAFDNIEGDTLLSPFQFARVRARDLSRVREI